ncbi:pseudouridine synthase [Irpex rosettiformis]|uniref:Pseudouridine synthase n=1 Tax=Irpex rosettiformis TaxID=378272 RepID=A0ACB8TRX0_9APHY|nr:pseudouridine synthase [Irpex rosettiformis]
MSPTVPDKAIIVTILGSSLRIALEYLGSSYSTLKQLPRSSSSPCCNLALASCSHPLNHSTIMPIQRLATSVRSISGLLGRSAHVIYTGPGVLVVNKPAGSASQPSLVLTKGGSVRLDTILPSSGQYHQAGTIPWPCYHLDKEASGALLYGKNPHVIKSLSSQFATGKATRKYLAILCGEEKNFPKKEFQVGTLFENDGRSVRVFREGIVRREEEAMNDEEVEENEEEENIKTYWTATKFKVLATSPVAPLALVELQPTTDGRYQLRVDTARIGAPILGDSRHAPTELSPQVVDLMDALEHELKRTDALYAALKEKYRRGMNVITNYAYNRRLNEIKETEQRKKENLYLHGSYIEYTHRYKKTSSSKSFRLGITAPLPYNFIYLCKLANIPLPDDYIDGGVYFDGVKQQEGELQELKMCWTGVRTGSVYADDYTDGGVLVDDVKQQEGVISELKTGMGAGRVFTNDYIFGEVLVDDVKQQEGVPVMNELKTE